MKKRLGLILLILVLLISTVSAESWYQFGSMKFSISAGPTVPLTLTTWGETHVGPGEGNTNFSVGGIGSIDYQVYLCSWFSLGAELGFQFNLDNNNDVFSSIPVLAKFTFVPVQTARFELPISFGVGGNYLSFGDYSKFAFGVTADIEARYFFKENWGIGIRTGFHAIFEWYANLSVTNLSKNGTLTNIPVMLSITYRN